MHQLCYDYALAYLSRYPKTSYDLDIQLKKKGYEPEEREEAILRLQEIGLLDDKKYAEQYLFSQVVRKGKPLFVAQQKLQQKGVDKAIVHELVEELEAELLQGQQTKIKKEIERREEKGLDQQSIIKKMQSRGYAYRDVQDIYDERE